MPWMYNTFLEDDAVDVGAGAVHRERIRGASHHVGDARDRRAAIEPHAAHVGVQVACLRDGRIRGKVEALPEGGECRPEVRERAIRRLGVDPAALHMSRGVH